MWLMQLSKRWLPCGAAGTESSKPPRQAAPRRRLRLTLEQLEDRSLPSNYTAASVSDLIADIHAANPGRRVKCDHAGSRQYLLVDRGG